jgi:hypothetical protein
MIKTATRELLFNVESGLLRDMFSIVERAMREGYELGLMQGQENIEVYTAKAFDHGYEKGAEVSGNDERWDDGYLAGVDDARSRPGIADSLVQDILNDRADEFFEALGDAYFDDGGPYNEDNVQDSGDEHAQRTYWYAD